MGRINHESLALHFVLRNCLRENRPLDRGGGGDRNIGGTRFNSRDNGRSVLSSNE